MMKPILILLMTILFTLWLMSCFNPKDYDTAPIASSDQLSFITSSVENIPADGVTSATIAASISNQADVGRRAVVFKTDLGMFVDGKGDSIIVPVNEQFIATANLVSVNDGRATVKAKILGLTAASPMQVSFQKAYPSSISVSVDSFAVSGNYRSELTLVASLRTASGGRPTVGHDVTFDVKQANESVGDFLNNRPTTRTDANGSAKIRFTPAPNAKQGYAIIIAATAPSATAPQSLTATSRIYIK